MKLAENSTPSCPVNFPGNNPYFWILITASVVVTFASVLLLLLLAKGFKEAKLGQYTLIYLLLTNMTICWSFQILAFIFYVPHSSDNDNSEAFFYMINLQPISTVLFGLKYFVTVEQIVGFQPKWKKYLLTLKVITVVSAIFLACLWTTTMVLLLID